MHYFDNAATTFPKPESVYRYMDYFYRNYGVNVGRGQFKEASIAFAMVKETRELLLRLFHVSYPYEVVFTSSATVAFNLIISSFRFQKDDIIYISPFEHNAVLRTLHAKQKEAGFKLFELPVNKKDLSIDLDKVNEMFKINPPNYCFITHASNSFGYILPIKDICNMAKYYASINVVDMAQTAGLIDINLLTENIDYIIFAGHKTLYGPLGVGGIVSNRVKTLHPLIYGGTGYDSKNMEMTEETPLKLEAGSLNILAIAGLNAALKWVFEIGVDNIRNKEREITKQLLCVLRAHRNLEVIRLGAEDENIGVVSCIFLGYSSDNIGQVLAENGIAVRTGLHCAPKGHDLLKTAPNGTVRFSISYFTTDEDISALDRVLRYIEMEG